MAGPGKCKQGLNKVVQLLGHFLGALSPTVEFTFDWPEIGAEFMLRIGLSTVTRAWSLILSFVLVGGQGGIHHLYSGYIVVVCCMKALWFGGGVETT